MLLNNDGEGEPVAGTVVTDSLRRRVVNFGQLRSNYSPTLTATEPADTFLSTDDFTEPGWSADEAVTQYSGISEVTASSSASDMHGVREPVGKRHAAVLGGGRQPGHHVGVGQLDRSGRPVAPGRLRVPELGSGSRASRHEAATIKVAFADNSSIGPPVTQVTVRTAAGQVTDPVRVTGDLQQLRVPSGASSWLRITVTGLAYQPVLTFGTQVGIAGIEVPGVSASRTILAPSVPGPDPAAVVLSKAQPQPSGCMLTSLRWVCSPALTTLTEEQYGFSQSFELPSAEQTVVHGSAVLTNASLADRYARLDQKAANVAASSTYTGDPQDQPRSAFDGNPATSWIASPLDQHPRLTIQWGYQRKLSKITIQRPPGAAGLLQVLLTGSRGQLRGGGHRAPYGHVHRR